MESIFQYIKYPKTKFYIPLQLRHNEQDGVSNHQRLDCLSTVCSGADQRKHQISASLAFVMGFHRWPMDSPHKGPVTRKVFHFMTSSCFETIEALLWLVTWTKADQILTSQLTKFKIQIQNVFIASYLHTFDTNTSTTAFQWNMIQSWNKIQFHSSKYIWRHFLRNVYFIQVSMCLLRQVQPCHVNTSYTLKNYMYARSNWVHTCGPIYQHGLTLIPAWISNYMPGKVRVKLLIHSQTELHRWSFMDEITVAPLKYGNG